MVEYVRRPGGDSKKRRKVSVWTWLLVPPMLIFALPTMILILVGMMPTLVAALIDRRPEKYAAYCVGGFNLSGVFPFLLKLWLTGHTMHGLGGIIGSPLVWLAMYGAAAFGWLCFAWTPEVVLRVQSMRDRQRTSTMRERQGKLVEEWGPEVIPPSTDGDPYGDNR